MIASLYTKVELIWRKLDFYQTKLSLSCALFPLSPSFVNFVFHPCEIQYRLKLLDHLPRFCLGRIAVLICGFTSAKPRQTSTKTPVYPRFFPVDLSRGERQDAVGFE